MRNYLVQQVDQRIGIIEEFDFETKDEAEKAARSLRADGFISYLWRLEFIGDISGVQHRVRRDGETFLPWRDFA